MSTDIQRLHVAARYSEAAVFNGVVYLAGMVPECEAHDIRSQTADVLQQIDRRLAEAGSDKSKIHSLTNFLRDMADYDGLNAEYDAWVADGHAPARACVEAKMYKPEVLVEMCVVAAV